MPNLFTFLRLDEVADATDGLTPVIKLLIDFFAGEGYAAATGAS
jgi:hypothetical protein